MARTDLPSLLRRLVASLPFASSDVGGRRFAPSVELLPYGGWCNTPSAGCGEGGGHPVPISTWFLFMHQMMENYDGVIPKYSY